MTDDNIPKSPVTPVEPPVQPNAQVPPPTYQQAPPQQQYAQPQYAQTPPQTKTRTAGFGSAHKEKWTAVVLAVVLGGLGIHKFYLGYKSEGMAMLLVCIIGSLCFGLGAMVMYVIGIIEAVKYVTLTEEDFQETYINNYKGWF